MAIWKYFVFQEIYICRKRIFSYNKLTHFKSWPKHLNTHTERKLDYYSVSEKKFLVVCLSTKFREMSNYFWNFPLGKSQFLTPNFMELVCPIWDKKNQFSQAFVPMFHFAPPTHQFSPEKVCVKLLFHGQFYMFPFLNNT